MPTFTLTLAHDVSVYGTVEIEADDLPSAIEQVRDSEAAPDAWGELSDVDYSTSFNFRVCHVEDEDGKTLANAIQISEINGPTSLSREEVLTALTAARISN
jgi:hypothetical protein